MNKQKKSGFLKLGFLRPGFLIFVIGAILLTHPASALSDELIRKYDNYQIYFYNAEQCVPGTTKPGETTDPGPDPDPDWETWDGSCTGMTAARISWIKSQISGMQKAASSNGIPWELIAAQAIAESGGGASEVCPYNPLGLKGAGPSCDGRHRTFNSYEEAYNHYVNNIISIKKVKNKYPNNPYAAIAYIQYGSGAPYAQCSKQEYLTNPKHACYGHKLGDPTPGYVNRTSSIICGLQKWAKSEGISISSVTWENYLGEDGDSDGSGGSGGGSGGTASDSVMGAVYCNGEDDDDDDDDDETDPSGLAEYVKAWAWPNYQKGKTERKPAYAKYIDNEATYKGACHGVDCGAFVANIIKASGWDTSYPQGGTVMQNVWLPLHWQKVSVNDLKLGDVGIKTGHVILYVGSIPGFNSKTASASQCDRAPMAGRSTENLNAYTWYRKK